MNITGKDMMKCGHALRALLLKRDCKAPSAKDSFLRLHYAAYLPSLMERALETGLENRGKTQIRQSGFIRKMCLNHPCRLRFFPLDTQGKVRLLERLDTVKPEQNVLPTGNVKALKPILTEKNYTDNLSEGTYQN